MSAAAYYNEIDQYAAAWLRNLIAAGHIAPGEVDTRSIEDVHPADLQDFTQCHFFAGVGVWSLALRRAGWPDDRSVWTGSCPCQPFSAAGKGAGFADERHLWPAFQHLIGERRPSVVIGEQVASKDADPWIDLVQDDLEGLGYRVGAVPFPSAGVGAPHIRDRLYWVANANQGQRGPRRPGPSEARRAHGQPSGLRVAGGVGDSSGARLAQRIGIGGILGRASGAEPGQAAVGTSLCPGGLADDASSGWREEHADAGRIAIRNREEGLPAGALHGGSDLRPGPTNGFWRDADWLGCRDGKWRPVEPGTFPLAHGAPGRVGRVRADQERIAALVPRKDQGSRVGRLRAYGNAINAEAARVFIESVMEVV